jgi:hypothetical protein
MLFPSLKQTTGFKPYYFSFLLVSQISLNVKGLTLKMPRLEPTCLETNAFEKMDRLKLLQFAGIQLDGDYKVLSKELRWLCWHGFPLEFIPEEFHQGCLVALELKYSNLKQVWGKAQV